MRLAIVPQGSCGKCVARHAEADEISCISATGLLTVSANVTSTTEADMTQTAQIIPFPGTGFQGVGSEQSRPLGVYGLVLLIALGFPMIAMSQSLHAAGVPFSA